MKFVDIAVNLTDPMFKGVYRSKQIHSSDFDLILKRSLSRNVEMVITGTCLETSKEALQLAKDHKMMATVGCHPTSTLQFVNYNNGSHAYLNDLRQLIQQGIKDSTIAAVFLLIDWRNRVGLRPVGI